MESINDINFEFEENPYFQYSAKELEKLRKREKISNAIIKVWLGIDNLETPELKKACRIEKNFEKSCKKD
jgi:hypothetical protein